MPTHVETVVLLGRKMVNDKSIEYMHVDYEPEDAEYLKGIKGSATYAEIGNPFEKRVTVNYDHPDSLETDLLVKHLK